MPTIIAECCQNHNGDKQILKDMIAAIAESGADYAKMQTITAADLSFRERFEVGAEGDSIERPYQAEYDRLKKLDLLEEDHRWFIEECHRAGVKPMTTVFTRQKVPFLASLDWNAVKVASYDCGSYPLIHDIKDRFDHLFISTGATYDEEIKKTAEILQGKKFSLFHCVTIYPTPLDQFHLARMNWLKQFTPSVGLSDHSLVARDGIKASVAALSLGADVIERHFTVLEPSESKDGPVSIHPGQLKELVEFSKLSPEDQKLFVKENIPEFDSMIGQETRDLSEEELKNRDYYRGRFVSKVDGKEIFNWEEGYEFT